MRKLPTKPGVYIFKDEKGKVLYVGKAKDLRKRVTSYFKSHALDAKTLRLVSEAKSLEHIVVASEIEAFLLESRLIKKYRPFFNIIFVDDKTYAILEINKKPIPYVVISRKMGNKNAVYFGPFTGITDLKIVLRLLRKIFPYQSVKTHSPKRCLYYHLGLCPCVTAYPENLPQYKKNIKSLISFFSGGKDKVIKSLRKEQDEYVKKEEFEEAGKVQKKIDRVAFITQENYDPFKYEEKPDFYFERIRAEVSSLAEISNKYGLNVGDLHRIECYDISNISGKNATGSMVVFINGDADKSLYRRFKIKFKKTPDDFAMHREVLQRRVKRDDWEKPNLIVIDGGKGQVSTALRVLAEANYQVPIIGLAKREETIVIPIKTGRELDFIEVKLPHSTPGVNLLRRLRDEAHRFAITYHRLLRKKSSAL
ncbi:MAG: hypothetical protein A2776_00155 [Candidatus Levybacteria bacterium RIFCSPHIGHO2_01_FULL_40_10]|nr:MAG: hypothetical protein A2776_00155 [Candidatus Levybacteria bacterium RIFCSPHIGHO2_01_FULL_40_10]